MIHRKNNIKVQALTGCFRLLMVLIAIVSVVSCTDEEMVSPSVSMAEKNIVLELTVPHTKIPTTYLSAAAEKFFTGLTLLAYKDNNGTEYLSYKAIASNGDISGVNGSGTKWELNLPEGNYHRLLLIANADAEISATIGDPLSNLSNLTFRYIYPANGKWTVSIPMSGEIVKKDNGGNIVPNGIVIQKGVVHQFNNINMIRMVAKVDVRNNVKSNFTLKEVNIYNMNDRGLIISDDLRYRDSPARPKLPIYYNLLAPITYQVTSSGNLNSEIYLFEAYKPVLSQIATSPRIIIKGEYMGGHYYYPVDFTYDSGSNKGSFMPIVRNHHYIFSINKVTGPGFTSVTDALNSQDILTNDALIQVQSLAIDENLTDVYYNGTDYLALNSTNTQIQMGIQAYTSAVIENTITIATSISSFDVNCFYADGTPTPTTVIEPRKRTTDVWLKAPHTGGGTAFDGYLIIRAGSLQSDKIPVHKDS